MPRAANQSRARRFLPVIIASTRFSLCTTLATTTPKMWATTSATVMLARSPCSSPIALSGWTAKQIHHTVLTTFHLSARAYGLNQLRYDLRKLKGHGLLQRDGSRYAYRLTPKVALLFLFFHKRLCGPLANSRFHHRPDTIHQPASKLEAAYHRADNAIQQIVDLLPPDASRLFDSSGLRFSRLESSALD